MGIVIVVGSTTIVIGQEAPRAIQPAEAETRAKLVAELAAATVQRSVKNLPFSADEVSESVQTLADGNRIVRSSTGKIYRNGEGRVRREHSGGTGGMLGSFYTTAPNISLFSPADGQNILLDLKEKTAKVRELTQAQRELVIVEREKASTEEARAKTVDLLRQQPVIVTGTGAGGTGFAATATGVGPGFAYSTGGGGRYETRTVELGTRDFEGVSAEGTRRITTIPAGAIGNEMPIETVYERWYSKELGMVVYSRNTDPRFGEQTYRLTNIIRAEPDPSLFSIPTGYRRVAEPGNVYRINSSAKPLRAVPSARPVNVVSPGASSRP